MKEHKNFYQNIYYSSSEKEFLRLYTRRIIDFYSVIIRLQLQGELDEEMQFSLEVYSKGGCEKIFEWIMSGMKCSPKQLCRYLYVSMPENVRAVLADQPFPNEVIKDIQTFRIENIVKN